MTLVIVNYVVRAIVIVIGALVALGILASEGIDAPVQQTFGVLMIVFGAYRIVLYHVRRKEGSPRD